MAVLSLALVCDGTSDLSLVDLITWMMDTHFPELTFRVVPALEVIPARGPLGPRLARAVQLYQPNLLFCHRDAERATLAERTTEIEQAVTALAIPAVPLIPVRMLEAWLLFDEPAIRSAADNRSGRIPLNLPSLSEIENLPDPKDLLLTRLTTASDLPARRRRTFNAYRARSRVSGFIQDYSPLRQLAAFQQFEERFKAALEQLSQPG